MDQILADEQVDWNAGAQDYDIESIFWPLTDHQGTVRDLAAVNGSGDTEIVNTRTYDTYGLVIHETDTGVDHLTGFTGRPTQTDAGLVNCLNRWYDPVIASWTTQDPITFQGGDANLYRYCGNDPVNSVDPSGLDPWLWPWEEGASWNPADTYRLWAYHSFIEHRRGLYTGDTDETPNTDAAMEGAGKSYNANKGKAHDALQKLDMVDPTGLSGSVDKTLTGLEEGKSAQEIGGDIAAQYGKEYLQKKAMGFLKDKVSTKSGFAKKKPKQGATGKAGATDVPSWVKGQAPNVGESGKGFAERMMDAKYGPGNWSGKGPKSEFNKIKKWADRHFE